MSAGEILAIVGGVRRGEDHAGQPDSPFPRCGFGAVLIDGRISGSDHEEPAPQIAVVSQNVILFNDTVRTTSPTQPGRGPAGGGGGGPGGLRPRLHHGHAQGLRYDDRRESGLGCPAASGSVLAMARAC